MFDRPPALSFTEEKADMADKSKNTWLQYNIAI